jgi:hypothetical protein
VIDMAGKIEEIYLGGGVSGALKRFPGGHRRNRG